MLRAHTTQANVTLDTMVKLLFFLDYNGIWGHLFESCSTEKFLSTFSILEKWTETTHQTDIGLLVKTLC